MFGEVGTICTVEIKRYLPSLGAWLMKQFRSRRYLLIVRCISEVSIKVSRCGLKVLLVTAAGILPYGPLPSILPSILFFFLRFLR